MFYLRSSNIEPNFKVESLILNAMSESLIIYIISFSLTFTINMSPYFL